MEHLVPSEKLNLDELFKQKKITEEHKIKMYNKILTRIHKKIKYASRQRGNEQFCCCVLPEFVLGIPRYDIATCNSYIMQQLVNNGFQVKYTHPNLLFISWRHFIPDYERRAIKKKTGVNIDGFGNFIQKKNDKKDKGNTNNLMLNQKRLEGNIPVSAATAKKKEEDKFKQITSYKPSGRLIYNTKLIDKIGNTMTS